MLLQTAWASYGPIVDGYPNWGERSLHMWTNAVRVDPKAFESEYPCSFSSFTETEQTPQSLLYYDFNLNDAARFHTDDMETSGVFSHTSSDGTSFFDRVARFYGESGYIGENIAMGYGDTYAAIFYGWMCSDGHRSNIMHPEYNELGTGVLGIHYTQDFANGVVETSSPIAMGLHDPELPGETVLFLADWEARAPDTLDVVLDGESIPMSLAYGKPQLGVYTLSEPVLTEGCHTYWFRWAIGERSGSYPEQGSYLFGTDCGGETWTEAQPLGESDTGDSGWEDGDLRLKGCLCSGAGETRSLVWLLLPLVGILARRR